jgi:hypothetical protein
VFYNITVFGDDDERGKACDVCFHCDESGGKRDHNRKHNHTRRKRDRGIKYHTQITKTLRRTSDMSALILSSFFFGVCVCVYVRLSSLKDARATGNRVFINNKKHTCMSNNNRRRAIPRRYPISVKSKRGDRSTSPPPKSQRYNTEICGIEHRREEMSCDDDTFTQV